MDKSFHIQSPEPQSTKTYKNVLQKEMLWFYLGVSVLKIIPGLSPWAHTQ